MFYCIYRRASNLCRVRLALHVLRETHVQQFVLYNLLLTLSISSVAILELSYCAYEYYALQHYVQLIGKDGIFTA